MGSLFTSFNSGVSGIHSAQSGLNTTSHNLANVKTAGYTRQQNIQVDAYYQGVKVSLDKSLLKTGMGTSVSEIRQIRDMFLDKEYRIETGRKSFYEKLADTEKEVEDIFGETEGVEFRDNLQKLWNVMQSMSTNPEDITRRQLFISTAEDFLETAQNAYSQLKTYQTSLNAEIKDQVDRVNEIGEKLAFYNGKVVEAEASGMEHANDYRDARNQLLDELADYTYYTYEENIDGSMQVYIDNALFVDGEMNFHLGCERYPTSDMFYIKWQDNGYGKAFEVSEAYASANKTDVGSIRGVLTARGDRVANYADMPIEPKQSDFVDAAGNYDETAYKVAMKAYQREVKNYNNTTANSIIMQIQAQFDQLVHNVVQAINDAFAPNIEVDGTQINFGTATITDAKGNTVNPTSLQQEGLHVLDVIHCPVGSDDAETIGTEVFSRSQIDRYQVLTLDQQIYTTDAQGNQIGLARQNDPDASGNITYTLYVYNEEDIDDIDWMYSLNSLKINEELMGDYSLLEVKANPALGLSGAYAFGENLFQDLLNSWDQEINSLDPNSLAIYTYDDYYSNMIGAMGAKGNNWTSMTGYQTSLTESIEDRRQQMSGVSSDEELVSLLKYQHAYNASSRYINAIDSMLAYLIERLA